MATYNIQLAKEKINSILTGINAITGIVKSNGDGTISQASASDIPSLDASKITSGTFADAMIASASTWNAKASKPTTATISIDDSWAGSSSPYTHSVSVSGVTANSKVDIQPDSTAIAQMVSDSVTAIYISNNNGTLTAYAVGNKPTASLSLQVTVTEVA